MLQKKYFDDDALSSGESLLNKLIKKYTIPGYVNTLLNPVG